MRNTRDRWGWVAQFLHWSVALGVIGLAIVGLLMDEMRASPDKVKVYALHKSVGLTVLVLVAVRLLWRLIDRRPEHPPMPAWQRALASISHLGLYAMLLAMPLSGWLYNSASNFPLQWFWLFNVPSIWTKDSDMRHLSHDVHEYGFYVLAVLFAVHVAGALKHHLIDRDNTLAAMTPGVSPLPPRPVAPTSVASPVPEDIRP